MPVTSCPSNRIEPSLGLSSPAMRRMREVLPDKVGPSSTFRLPRGRTRFVGWMCVAPPTVFEIFRSSSICPEASSNRRNYCAYWHILSIWTSRGCALSLMSNLCPAGRFRASSENMHIPVPFRTLPKMCFAKGSAHLTTTPGQVLDARQSAGATMGPGLCSSKLEADYLDKHIACSFCLRRGHAH